MITFSFFIGMLKAIDSLSIHLKKPSCGLLICVYTHNNLSAYVFRCQKAITVTKSCGLELARKKLRWWLNEGVGLYHQSIFFPIDVRLSRFWQNFTKRIHVEGAQFPPTDSGRDDHVNLEWEPRCPNVAYRNITFILSWQK